MLVQEIGEQALGEIVRVLIPALMRHRVSGCRRGAADHVRGPPVGPATNRRRGVAPPRTESLKWSFANRWFRRALLWKWFECAHSRADLQGNRVQGSWPNAWTAAIG